MRSVRLVLLIRAIHSHCIAQTTPVSISAKSVIDISISITVNPDLCRAKNIIINYFDLKELVKKERNTKIARPILMAVGFL